MADSDFVIFVETRSICYIGMHVAVSHLNALVLFYSILSGVYCIGKNAGIVYFYICVVKHIGQ